MSSKASPLSNFQSPESLRLGCLIVNPEDFGQDNHYPFEDRPTPAEVSVSDHGTFHETQTLSKSSKLRSFLSDVLSVSRERGNEGSFSLDAAQVTIQNLRNHSNWFQDACGIPETRRWLEKAHNNGFDTYLLVGLFIARDAKLATTSNSTIAGARGVGVPLLPAALTMLGTIVSATTGVRCTRDVSHGRVSLLDMPGDKILGIWYRKVKFKWSVSKEVGSPSLGKKTRWKPYYWKWRGGKNDDREGADGERDQEGGEEGEGEEEGEEEEIMEVCLEGESDLEDNDSSYGGDCQERAPELSGCYTGATSETLTGAVAGVLNSTKRKRGHADSDETLKNSKICTTAKFCGTSHLS